MKFLKKLMENPMFKDKKIEDVFRETIVDAGGNYINVLQWGVSLGKTL